MKFGSILKILIYFILFKIEAYSFKDRAEIAQSGVSFRDAPLAKKCDGCKN